MKSNSDAIKKIPSFQVTKKRKVYSTNKHHHSVFFEKLDDGDLRETFTWRMTFVRADKNTTKNCAFFCVFSLTLSWRRPISCRNWCLYDIGLRHERVKGCLRYKTIFSPLSNPWCVINEFFYLKKKCFVLEKSWFLCFCEIYTFQNLWRHHRYCHIMEATLLLIYFES